LPPGALFLRTRIVFYDACRGLPEIQLLQFGGREQVMV
jgi:hypothetical protein